MNPGEILAKGFHFAKFAKEFLHKNFALYGSTTHALTKVLYQEAFYSNNSFSAVCCQLLGIGQRLADGIQSMI